MPAVDKFEREDVSLGDPYSSGAAVTPNDGTDLAYVTRALWIGGAGNLKVTLLDGSAVTLNGCAAGQVVPVRAARVWATGTTATNIVALY